jgi:hypothetical protein
MQGGLKWHNIHTNFDVNLFIDSKVIKRQTQGQIHGRVTMDYALSYV